MSLTPTEEAEAALKKSAAQYEDWVKSLEEQKKRLANLQVIEKRFLATRDMALLEEFRDKREIPEIELAEKTELFILYLISTFTARLSIE